MTTTKIRGFDAVILSVHGLARVGVLVSPEHGLGLYWDDGRLEWREVWHLKPDRVLGYVQRNDPRLDAAREGAKTWVSS